MQEGARTTTLKKTIIPKQNTLTFPQIHLPCKFPDPSSGFSVESLWSRSFIIKVLCMRQQKPLSNFGQDTIVLFRIQRSFLCNHIETIRNKHFIFLIRNVYNPYQCDRIKNQLLIYPKEISEMCIKTYVQ